MYPTHCHYHFSVGGAVLVGMAPNGSDNGDLTLNIGAVYAAGGACL